MQQTDTEQLFGKQYPVFDAGSSSILGMREYQQDACWFTVNSEQHELMAVVCDGMGGLSGGERASQSAVSELTKRFRTLRSVPDIPAFFREAAVAANNAVCSLTDDAGKTLGAGSTIVSVVIREDRLFWLSIGDSRIYLIRNCEIFPCCVEHNYEALLKERIQANEITREEADADPTRRDALTSYLGMRNMSRMEINDTPVQLLPNDMLLLCSDGLYKSLSDEEICRIAVENRINPQYAAETLTGQALAHATGKQDNTTAIVIQFNGELFRGKAIR
ncbi:MAG: serine/threonine-protein phosphatase [Oscillospiraceae bacterium]|nr:serine/threonine-protein phosphatase [Oscillospiraceae bacterium]